MSLLTVVLAVFAASMGLMVLALTWYFGNWKIAAVVGGGLLFQTLHIVAFVVPNWGEVWRAALLVIHPVGTLSGGILGATMWFLFYEGDKDDVFRVDPRGVVIGHKGIPRERREDALLVGGDELPTRRMEGTNDEAFLVKDWHFREDAPDLFVVPPEKSLPPDEAAAHVGKMIKADERLEARSRALDLLEHSIVGLCERAYKKGKGHAMVAREDLSAASDLTVNYHGWIQEKKETVRRNVEKLKDARGDDVKGADGVDDINHAYDGVEDDDVRDEVEATNGSAEAAGEATHE